MTLSEALILGIIQGFTEFLPISSSGHLVLSQHFLGIDLPGNAFEVTVHLGTLFSVLVVFRSDIRSLIMTPKEPKTRRYLLTLLTATLPAAVVGIVFRESLTRAFDQVGLVILALMLTGIILVSTRWLAIAPRPLTLLAGLVVGLAQAVAIIPGISRSGITITAGLVMGLSAVQAARFSFLLALPAIAGAALFSVLQLPGGFPSGPVMAVGLTSSFLMGVLALKWLLGVLQSGRFYWFGIYCLALATIILVAGSGR